MLEISFSRRELLRKALSLFGIGVFFKLVNKSFGRNRFDLNKTGVSEYKGIINTGTGIKKFKFFDEHQAATVMALARTIIPTDKDPGAVEAGVAYYIDNVASKSLVKQKNYKKGIQYIDEFSKRKFGKEFLQLESKNQLEILEDFEKALQILYRKSPYLPSQKWRNRIFVRKKRLDYRMNLLLGGVNAEGARFFRTLKWEMFDAFYSNPISWKMIGYQGPPQFSGYPDYGKCKNNEKGV